MSADRSPPPPRAPRDGARERRGRGEGGRGGREGARAGGMLVAAVGAVQARRLRRKTSDATASLGEDAEAHTRKRRRAGPAGKNAWAPGEPAEESAEVAEQKCEGRGEVGQGAEVRGIGDAVEAVAQLNDSLDANEVDGDPLLLFRGSKVPSFQFRDYIARLVSYLTEWKVRQTGAACDVGLRSLLMALVYADRIQQLHPRARISSWNVHRLVLTGMLVATKFTEDRQLSNRFWAQVGGLPLAEMNRLECELCALLKFNLFICEADYRECESKVMQHNL